MNHRAMLTVGLAVLLASSGFAGEIEFLRLRPVQSGTAQGQGSQAGQHAGVKGVQATGAREIVVHDTRQGALKPQRVPAGTHSGVKRAQAAGARGILILEGRPSAVPPKRNPAGLHATAKRLQTIRSREWAGHSTSSSTSATGGVHVTVTDNTTQVAIGKNVSQHHSDGQVRCADLKGKFKSNVSMKEFNQVGSGRQVDQSMTTRSVVGNCTR